MGDLKGWSMPWFGEDNLDFEFTDDTCLYLDDNLWKLQLAENRLNV
jgi:hypothetical protein